MRRNLLIFTGILLLALPQFLFAQSRTVAVLTPFLAQPGTQLMVEGFEAAAKSKGWQVDVIDTSGDVAALVSRMEDVALQKVDAMVINVDPSKFVMVCWLPKTLEFQFLEWTLEPIRS